MQTLTEISPPQSEVTRENPPNVYQYTQIRRLLTESQRVIAAINTRYDSAQFWLSNGFQFFIL